MGMTGDPVTMPFVADGAITVNRAVMKGAAADDVKVTTGADVATIGLAQATAADNEKVDVAISGTSVGVASAAIAIGDMVTAADNAGKLKTAAPAGGANSRTIGMAVSAATGDGVNFLVLINQGSMQGA